MARLDLIQGDYSDPATWESLRATLDKHDSSEAVFYMAIPPTMFPTVAHSLASVGLNERGRIVVEKPFGRDLQSARELNETLHSVFPEDRIFRIDHYLGKESVEDLLVFRFSNTLLEPVWNRNYVRSVQITMSETIGVEGRGSFYDSVGAIRDVMQNHLLQVLALLAMEPPVGPEARLPAGREGQGVRGDAPDRPEATSCAASTSATATSPASTPNSQTETFAAARLEIDSWRWAGVPWYVRCGKALATAATEVVVEFREPPSLLFDEAGGPAPDRNLVRFRLGKNDGVTFTLQAKTPGQHLDSQNVDVAVDFAAALGERREAYERLLDDAIAGLAAPVRPRGRRRADVAGRPAGARPTRPGAPVLPRLVGPGRGRPHPLRRPLVRRQPRLTGSTGGAAARGTTTMVPSSVWWTVTLTP